MLSLEQYEQLRRQVEGQTPRQLKRFLDFDKKRLVYKLEMIHKKEKYLAATTEVCSLYVDLTTRRVTEFEDEKKQLINKFVNENKDNFKPGTLKLINKLKK